MGERGPEAGEGTLEAGMLDASFFFFFFRKVKFF